MEDTGMSLSYFKLKKFYFSFLLKFISKLSLYPFGIIFFLIVLVPNSLTYAQSNWFSLPTYWEVSEQGLAFNIEAFDMNKDSHLDIVVGNWNDTYVYYGGAGILDDTVDLTYTGRMLAVCDYNGDGYDDLIAMHFTNYDSTRFDYDGEILFYWGNDTAETAIDTIADVSVPLPTLHPTTDKFALGFFTTGTQYGDFNNDGKKDLVLNSFNYGQVQIGISVGKIYVYMGNEIPPDNPDFTAQGKFVSCEIQIRDYGNYFQIGNINDDEYEDLLLSSQLRTKAPCTPDNDSLEVLSIFYGSQNFSVHSDSESVRYESRVNYQQKWAEWFKQTFSIDDIYCDSIDDLIIGRLGFLPTVVNVHYGQSSGIDTIPSFIFTDIDTSDQGLCACGISESIGDFNNDGYDDFILRPAGYSIFSLHLGGPYVGNHNPHGRRGFTPLTFFFPSNAVSVGDQNNDGFSDFAVSVNAFSQPGTGHVLIMLGQDRTVGINEKQSQIISNFRLYPNHPNPFNPTTSIQYSIASKQNISLKVYDVLGNEIATLVNEEKLEGEYKIEFNAEKYKLSSGVYFGKLYIKGGGSSSIKMIYLK